MVFDCANSNSVCSPATWDPQIYVVFIYELPALPQSHVLPSCPPARDTLTANLRYVKLLKYLISDHRQTLQKRVAVGLVFLVLLYVQDMFES